MIEARYFVLGSYAAVTVGLIAAATGVSAQQASPPTGLTPALSADGDGEIVVTARKRDERLIDVPETVNAFTGASLERAGIRTLDDLGHDVPNVIFSRRADNEPNVVVRGVGSLGNVQGVGFYFDDVQNFTDQSSRLVDLERVEVLKGPQGTLYGGSSIGGAVKYVTKKPGEELEGSFGLEAGQYRTYNVNGSVNVPLSPTAFLRVSAYSDNSNGYSLNPIVGQNNDESHEYGIRAALRLLPKEGTEIIIGLRHSYLNNGGNDYYLNNANSDYRYDNPLNFHPFNKRDIWAGTLLVNQEIGGATLTSLTSYTERKAQVHWDLDYSPMDIVSTPITDNTVLRTPVFTQELRLASHTDSKLQWLVGLYTASIKDRGTALQGDIILGPDATGGPPIRIKRYREGSSLEKTYAGFGDLTYRTGRLEVTVGARLNYNDFRGTNGNLDPSTASLRETRVLPKVSLSYRASPETRLYAVISEGYEPGKVNIIGTSLAPYKGETAINYEVGAKGDIGNKTLAYEVAAFYISNKNRQFETQFKDATNVPVDVTTDIGAARSYGAEAALSLRPTKGLILSADVGYLDAKFKKASFNGATYVGTAIPNAPKFTGLFSIDYSVPVLKKLRLSGRVDVSHTDSFYWDIPNQSTQPAYNLLGARIAIASRNDAWEFAVRADNILNQGYNTEFYYNYSGDPTVGPDSKNAVCDMCHLAHVGQPRTVLATFNYHFR